MESTGVEKCAPFAIAAILLLYTSPFAVFNTNIASDGALSDNAPIYTYLGQRLWTYLVHVCIVPWSQD